MVLTYADGIAMEIYVGVDDADEELSCRQKWRICMYEYGANAQQSPFASNCGAIVQW